MTQRALIALFGCVLLPGSAQAHARPLSYSSIELSAERIDVSLQITDADVHSMDLPAAGDDSAALERAGRLLQQRLLLVNAEGACRALGPPERRAASAPWLIWHWSLRCRGASARQVEARFLVRLESDHRHLVKLVNGRAEPVDRVLTIGEPSWAIDERPASGLGDYLVLGIEHLLTGWDHMVFLLALLLAARLRDVLLLVTSFTVAHSITLALAALGFVVPTPGPVEALIAFSVALLGAENSWLVAGRGPGLPLAVVTALLALAIWGGTVIPTAALIGLALFCVSHFALLRRTSEPGLSRAVISFAFGLIHGFGFAGVMAELDLPAGRLAQALLGFNLGVELAQVALVLACWPALRALERLGSGRAARLFHETASAAICGIGLFWFLIRLTY